MKRINLMKNVCGIGLTLLLLFGCSPQATLTPTPIPPTLTPIPPTPTPIPPTFTPTSTFAISPQVEQARAFADPILAVIANYPPDFEDNFSSDKGWTPFGAPCPYIVVDGVMRFQLDVESCVITNSALARRDFVLQFDGRITDGDMMSDIQILFHATNVYYSLRMVSKALAWSLSKGAPIEPAPLISFGQGTGLVSPIGETTRVVIVARGPRCSIYINNTPVAYFEDPDFDTAGATSFWCDSNSHTVCELDNIKLWELAKVPGLP